MTLWNTSLFVTFKQKTMLFPWYCTYYLANVLIKWYISLSNQMTNSLESWYWYIWTTCKILHLFFYNFFILYLNRWSIFDSNVLTEIIKKIVNTIHHINVVHYTCLIPAYVEYNVKMSIRNLVEPKCDNFSKVETGSVDSVNVSCNAFATNTHNMRTGMES